MASTINADNGVSSGSAGVKTTADSSGVLALQTNGTTAVTVDTSQNVGVGVTPSAWNTYTALQVQQLAVASFTNGDGRITNNAYYDSGWKYIGTNYAVAYNLDAGGGAHKWFTAASGTAGNTITFTQAMTLDTGGLNVATSTGNCYVKSARASKSTGQVAFQLSGGTSGTDWIIYQPTNSDNLTFFGNSADRVVILSNGQVLITGTATQPSSSVKGINLSPDPVNINPSRFSCGSATGDITQIQFINGNGTVGSISTNGSATAFNTSSDVRLKKNIVDAQDAGSDVDALQVRQFDWKVDDLRVKYGFVAQELVTVVPEAVSVGDDGEEIEKTWGVDYSKLVPMLVKEIQSLRARSAVLEAEVAALKAR